MSEAHIVLKKFTEMKHKALFFIVAAAFFLLRFEAHASWLIDPERFHISVHGTTSCIECHSDMENQDVHPDPGNVNKRITDFFTADMCADCHDAVEDFVEAGFHGDKEINSPGDIENCLRCHDPHYESDAVTAGTGFAADLPIKAQCGVCHEKAEQLPPLDAEDEDCMTCHRRVGADQPDDIRQTSAFCLHCHEKTEKKAFTAFVPFIDANVHKKGPHQGLSCLTCHPEAAKYGHTGNTVADCLNCHSYHDEGDIHDAHITVSCEACHLGGVSAVRDDAGGKIIRQKNRFKPTGTDIHQMVPDEDTSCERCHFTGNTIGAASMVLPSQKCDLHALSHGHLLHF